jgi:hypothetical protein
MAVHLPVITQELVPAYSQGGPSHVGAGAFTAGAEALQRAGYEAQRVGEDVLQRHLELQQQEDEARSTEQALAFRRDKSKYLYNPEDGALFTQGAQAMGIYDKAEADLEAMRRGYGAQLTTQRQRQLFEAKSGLDLESSLNQIAEHQATATRQYAVDQQKAAIDTLVEAGIANADNPTGQAAVIGLMTRAIRSNPQGLPEVAVDFQVNEATSKIHSGVVAEMAYRAPDAAMHYLAAHGGEIQPSDRLAVEQHIDAGLRRRMMEQEHNMALAEKAKRDLQEQRAKEGDVMLLPDSKTPMTPDWLRQHKNELSDSDLRYFTNQLREGANQPPIRSNPDVLIDLHTRFSQGEDPEQVRASARDAFRNKLISEEDYKSLDPLQAEPSWWKDAVNTIKGRTGYSEINPAGGGVSYSTSYRDFSRWTQTHRDASWEDAIKEAERIADNNRTIGAQDAIFTADKPKVYLRDANGLPDIRAMVASLENQRLAGTISPTDYAEDSRRIARLAQLVAQLQGPQTQPTGEFTPEQAPEFPPGTEPQGQTLWEWLRGVPPIAHAIPRAPAAEQPYTPLLAPEGQ